MLPLSKRASCAHHNVKELDNTEISPPPSPVQSPPVNVENRKRNAPTRDVKGEWKNVFKFGGWFYYCDAQRVDDDDDEDGNDDND